MERADLRRRYHAARVWLWPIPFLVACLALIATAVAYLWPQPYDGLTWSPASGEVVGIDPAAPAANAGVVVGDIIVAIDEVPFARAQLFYREKRAGETVVFSLLRRGESRQAKVTLGPASPGILALWLEPLLIALGLWLTGLVALALRPAAREARLFFLVNQVGSGVLSAGLLSTFGLELASRLFNMLLCWISPLIIHFHVVFPVLLASRRRRLLLGFLYGTALVLSLPYAFCSLPRLKSVPGYLFLYNGIRLYLALALLAAVILLLRNYLLMPSQPVRQRIRVVVFGSALALTPLVALSLLPEAVQGRPLVAYELSFPFLLLSPLAYGYAIYRHNLFQTDRILNRSLVYLSLGILWMSFYLVLLASLDWLFPGAIPSGGAVVGAALILAMAMLFVPLKERVQALVDRLFYGGWYDYSTVVARFSQALSAALDEAALVELLVERLPPALRVRGAALVLPANDRTLTMRASRGLEEIRLGSIRRDGTLARFLQEGSGPLEPHRLGRHLEKSDLSIEERGLVASSEIALWMPLVFRGKLEGILLLGSKMADDVYSDEDYAILETLARQAATTAENVRLVGELRQRLEEIGRSKRKLEEAHRRLLTGREEERKRIAREVHNGLLQDLIGMSYRLRDYGRQGQGSALEGPLEELREESLRLLGELRRICTDLRPPALDVLGLASAIRSHSEEEMKTGPSIELELMDDRGQLPEEVAISLFRIYQEALANAVKHADANQIVVRLELCPDSCILSIWDNGRGFVVPRRLEELAREGHFGLLGIQERVEAMGGSLEVASAPGAGTEVRVRVRLDATE
ncbi:MAG TPA: hypothetical protein DCP08_06575 [Chloroflexi bacterium]|nr:hypothetical protein [Chloroflexota bacterium]